MQVTGDRVMNGMVVEVIKTCTVFESPISEASTAVCSKAVALLFPFIVYCSSHCLCCYVFGPCFVMQY